MVLKPHTNTTYYPSLENLTSLFTPSNLLCVGNYFLSLVPESVVQSADLIENQILGTTGHNIPVGAFPFTDAVNFIGNRKQTGF